mmetsp:Transcript_5656/g.10726  ORF Transcript_5656/g.10726 Transcript_5656/m.10726 type:complete len:379 (-) Transcript_5656:570-1706(-)|eukprot:CAMPEP_0178503340 /NCGR_PEP_ID=MMETSP0696-20121128/17989_1 /TAXON_ID=265572 /ORGANISM="Extubocellulus spinifer, Strain CCMP396" /LENGTH=378 /DNA_ID=CAMNT_0020132465 /DNA_START=87 /DNA_END=1223 /DNA_ORIENTATION=-
MASTARPRGSLLDRLKRKGFAAAALLAGGTSAAGAASQRARYLMPDEADPHAATWVSYVARRSIWGRQLSVGVRSDLETIIRTIAKYEPVNVLVNPGDDYRRAAKIFANEANISLHKQMLNDLWVRDYGSVFVLDDTGDIGGIDFNFNAWGKKQAYGMDRTVASRMSYEAYAYSLSTFLVMEGGGIETDGHGTAIMTESCILNRNRNPRVTKLQAEDELKRLLGLEKIIWLPGIKGKDITDGHVDFYAKFVKPGHVVMAWDNDPQSWDYPVVREHYSILSKATDAQGNKLEITKLPNPNYNLIRRNKSDDIAAGYVNYYVGNEFVLMPEFGDTSADSFAQKTIGDLYPDRTVEVIRIDDLAEGGGGIHCATIQQPRVK